MKDCTRGAMEGSNYEHTCTPPLHELDIVGTGSKEYIPHTSHVPFLDRAIVERWVHPTIPSSRLLAVLRSASAGGKRGDNESCDAG